MREEIFEVVKHKCGYCIEIGNITTCNFPTCPLVTEILAVVSKKVGERIEEINNSPVFEVFPILKKLQEDLK